MLPFRNIIYIVLVAFAVSTVAIAFAILSKHKNSTTSLLNTKVEVDTTRPVQKVSTKFLSVSFDNRLLQQHWVNFNFSSARIYRLAQSLAPAYLRIGGTTEDWLIYQNESKPDNIYPTSSSVPHFQRDNFTEYNITNDDLDKIHLIASKAGWKVLFGLNVCLRTRGGAWNFSNPLQIMQYVASKGYNFGWELGNEPDLLGRWGKAIQPKILGQDFVTLRNILNRNPEYGKFMVGPDLTRPKNKSMDFLKEFLSVAVDAVDRITWHQYYFNSRTCKLQDFYDPQILDYLLHQLQLLNAVLSKTAPDKRHWLGETATAWGGGAYGMSNKYVATFTWMDKLGLAARLGAEIVVKQTFFHGNYALIDDDLNPTPNYWLSLLHKRLVGQTVLDVKDGLQEGRVVRVYAHCTDTRTGQYSKGAVTVMIINLSSSQDAVVSLTGTLGTRHVDQYLLTADGALTSQFVLLNGVRLAMPDDHTLPAIQPVTIDTGHHLHIPSLALGFFVVPQAQADACLTGNNSNKSI